jgi:hypothetical protein
MKEELWNRVDDFLSEVLRTSDPVLEAALRTKFENGSRGDKWFFRPQVFSIS